MFVSNIVDYIKDCIKCGAEIKSYRKFTIVRARKGILGEVVVTKMKNGLEETKNTVGVDEFNHMDWVITEPDGEKYVVKHNNFIERYEVVDASTNTYQPKRKIHYFIQINDNITFIAPWGEEMTIKKGGYINITDNNDIYGVQKDEFLNTYKECDKFGNFYDEELIK